MNKVILLGWFTIISSSILFSPPANAKPQFEIPKGEVCTKSNPPRCWDPDKVKRIKKPTCDSINLKICIGPNAKTDAKLFEKLHNALNVNSKNNPKPRTIAYCIFTHSGGYIVDFANYPKSACEKIKQANRSNQLIRKPVEFSPPPFNPDGFKPRVNNWLPRLPRQYKIKKGKINIRGNSILIGSCPTNFYVSLNNARDLKLALRKASDNKLLNCKLKIKNLTY